MRACSTAIFGADAPSRRRRPGGGPSPTMAVGPTGIPWRAVAFAKAAALSQDRLAMASLPPSHCRGTRPPRSFLSHGPIQMDTDVLDRIYKICRSRDGAICGCAEIRDRRDREKDNHGCLHDLKCESGVSAQNSVAPTAPYHCESATGRIRRGEPGTTPKALIHGRYEVGFPYSN